jgi:hypothetical protein
MTDIEAKVVEAWKQAAANLGFEFTSPFEVTLPDGSQWEHLGLVHRFGRRIGAIISVLHETSEKIPRPDEDEYFCSILGHCYASYDRQLFIDTLDDWQFFGPEHEKPKWYSGKSWS